jgi:hypothetical protein
MALADARILTYVILGIMSHNRRHTCRLSLVNAIVIQRNVSLDAGGLELAAPPEVAGDPTENETTGAYCEIEMIDNDKIVNVMHKVRSV